jgi:hypothetical protein
MPRVIDDLMQRWLLLYTFRQYDAMVFGARVFVERNAGQIKTVTFDPERD